MSSFDTVNIRCPNCNCVVPFQTKAGVCWCEEYNQQKVPLNLAVSIDGNIRECPNCHAQIVARFVNDISTVAMQGVDIHDDRNCEDEDDD